MVGWQVVKLVRIHDGFSHICYGFGQTLWAFVKHNSIVVRALRDVNNYLVCSIMQLIQALFMK